MLNGKTALISGISSDIGLATARKFLAAGAAVAGVGKKRAELDELGENFIFIECDVTKEAEVAAACDAVKARFGGLDCLVTICADLYCGSVLEVTEESFDAAARNIILAPMLLSKCCVPLLKKSKHGHIVHDFPTSAVLTGKDILISILNTSIMNYVRQCAYSLKPLSVSGCMFGAVDCDLMTESDRAFYATEKGMAKIPAGRIGKPEDVANLNAFLCSDTSEYISSAILEVDGGIFTTTPGSMGSAI